MTDKTGGPAFPTDYEKFCDGFGGMTLRDYFAGHAMQSVLLLSRPGIDDPAFTARAAYAYADAMIAERSK